MIELGSKVGLLTYYIEMVAKISCTIPNDHLARIYGRSLFLGIDSFLKLARTLKNNLRKARSLDGKSADALTEQIKKLTTDYESYYASLRDKLSAHQQEINDFVLLLEFWNEIDEVTLQLLTADVVAIWSALVVGGASCRFLRPIELDDPTTVEVFTSLATLPEDVRISLDRAALTCRGTISIIPLDLSQEKAIRVITAFDRFRVLVNSSLVQLTAHWFLSKKANVDLFVVDACSVLDNLFDDRPASRSVAAEDSLLTIWRHEGMRGVPILESFPRNSSFERSLRTLRNKVCAHFDGQAPLNDLLSLLDNFPLEELRRYMDQISACFNAACHADMRTVPFLHYNQTIPDTMGVRQTDAIKPFRTI